MGGRYFDNFDSFTVGSASSIGALHSGQQSNCLLHSSRNSKTRGGTGQSAKHPYRHTLFHMVLKQMGAFSGVLPKCDVVGAFSPRQEVIASGIAYYSSDNGTQCHRSGRGVAATATGQQSGPRCTARDPSAALPRSVAGGATTTAALALAP